MGQEYSSTSQGAELAEMRKIAVFTAQQVKIVKERFELLCDEDESVDRELFSSLLKMGQEDSNQLFDFFDSDQSGRVDYYEFISALTLLSNSTIDEKAEIIFDVYDLDSSQRISTEELILLMKEVLTSLNHMSKKAAPVAKKIEDKARAIFDRWDTDQDNSISLTEFKSIISKDPDILRLLISYGLMVKEELRADFGGGEGDIPDCDSDLENEIGHVDADEDERAEKIKLGIEYKTKEKDPDALYEEEEMGGGDEFMAVKPWLGTVKNSVPTGYAPKKGEADSPEASLELEYVHGYRCHDARNNLRYAPDGQAVYHTAAVGVVLNGKDNTQKFYIEHTDDITCLDMYGNLVATGQVGAKPLVCIWDYTTRQTKTFFQGDLQKSIALVCFSNDGKKLAAIANDDDHHIGIFNLEKLLSPNYDVRKAKVDGAILIGKGPKASVLDAKFDPTNTSLIISCVKEVNFVSFENNVIKCTKGTGWGNTPQQAVLCIGFIDQTIVTGAFNGSLLVWKGKSLSTTIPAHQGAVNAIWSRKTQKGIITGGNDCVINIWDHALKKIHTINAKQANIGSLNPKIRSICENDKGSLLVGLRGGEIVEFVNSQPKILMRGHFDDELWGLCVSPTKNMYITAGEDMLIASWDVATRKQKKGIKLDYKSKVLAYSPDEKFLAVGCVNGFVLVLDPNTFAITQTLKDRLKEISEIKFSPNSELVAVGAHDSEIFIYNVKKGFKIQAKLRGHHSTITHFDFSLDSSVLQSNCTSYEILYFDTKTGKRNPSGASANRNEPWATWTCILGWPVQGIWPECSDGSDINALDRHPLGNVLATADDFSKVKLFKYPCPVERSAFVKVVGHSSHVTNVRFTMDGKYLISTGGNDKSIFQWRYHFDQEADEQADVINKSYIDEEEIQESKKKEAGALFVEEEIDQGDEALAVKPFKGEVDRSKPTGWVTPKNAGAAPDGNLSLRYCHGYRCFDARNAAKYTSDPEKIVFISAALGVSMSIQGKDQTFFQMHEEDVVCLAVHPSGKYAATGQMAQKGKSKRIDMFVWEIESKTMLARLNDFHLRAVCLVEFSPDGSKLASIGRDDDNSLALYDWAKGLLITTVKVDKAKVNALSYKNESEFFTCGLKHVKFYTANGKNIKAQRGTLDASQQNEAFLCGVYAFNGVAVCGTQSGNLIPFNGTAASKSVQAHTGGVGTVCAIKNALISGGNDGKVLVWSWASGKLSKTAEFCNMATISKFVPGIVSLDARPDGNTLLIGTRGGEIYEVNKTGNKEILLQGHYDGELWGCSVCPNALKYVTCGGDKTIRLWDAKKPWMLASTKPLENDVRAVDWAPNGKFIVAGDWKGKIMILDPKDLTIKDALQSSFTKQHQWLEDIKVSPDGTLVAFGAHGGPSPVEVMSIKNDSKLSKMYNINAGLTSALLHLDWSVDSSHVVVNSQAYELKFVNIAAKKNTAASGAKDFEWASWTCKLGFPVQGVFQSVDYSDVNTVCRSNSKKILASGDDNQKVNLFKYPCVVERAQCKSYIGHSSHVTRVRFTFDDTRLISTGGNDKAVLIWRTDFGAGAEDAEDVDESTPDFDDDPNEYIEKKVKRDKYGRPVAGADEEEEDEDPNAIFKAEKVGGGDEFLAVKPWLGAIKPPSDFKNAPVYQHQPPKVDLTLEYVHGYRAKDCRNNVRYLKSGKIVYHAAALGIVTNLDKNTQKFFNLHIDDITSMDVHPNGIFVATGEIGPKPSIYVWDSNSMQVIFHFKGGPTGLEKGIANLAFSPSGNRLGAVAVDDNHKIGVYDTEVGSILAVEKGDTAKIVDLKFKSDSEFVSVGPKHFKHWNYQNKQMSSKKGQFGNANNLLRCIAWNDNTCLTGAADGNLHTWNGNALGKSYPLHKNGLDALYVSTQYVITGGGDGIVVISDKKTYAALLKVQLDSIIKTSFSTKLRSACFSEDHKNILIGTYGSEIYELSLKDSKIAASTKLSLSREVVKGHYTPNQKWTNEVWGLGVFSDNDKYCTCSDDATLRVWSASQRKQIASTRLDVDLNGKEIPKDQATQDLDDSAKGRSIDVSPDDKYIAVGCKDGTFRIFEADTLKQTHIIKVAKEWIQELKFSPDGTMLAVGSHDNAIYLFTVPNFQKKYTMRKHSSFITHLDWSVDSSSLHSNCGAYELLFWNMATGKQVTGGATAFRDEKWATWTCVLGWPVQGIWPPFTSGDDINYVSRSSGKPTGEYEILASGDDFGKVRLLRYPSLQKGSEAVTGVGHSSHVTCVKFSPDDNLLVSTGGEDNCVFQWRVSPTV